MTVLIVGGDNVASFTQFLSHAGFSDFQHWSGRKAGDHHQRMPLDTSLVVLLVDQVNHLMATKVKDEAFARNVPVVYTPRSRARLVEQLQRKGLLEQSVRTRMG